jgi:hypothetical protein
MGNMNRLLVTTASAAAIAAGAFPSSAAARECSPARQRDYIERHIDNGKHFRFAVLEGRHENAYVQVTDPDRPGELMVNPLVIRCGGRIISYAARINGHLDTLPADDSTVTTQIGHHSFDVDDPEAITSPLRELHAEPDTGVSPVGFVDAGGKSFGVMP